MRNKYEFRLEDIHTVVITEKNELHYSTIYNRHQDTRTFVQTYGSDVEEAGDKVIAICNRCEAYNIFDKEEYYSKDFVYECNKCHNANEEFITEDELLDVINSILDKDTFFDFDLFINYQHIV